MISPGEHSSFDYDAVGVWYTAYVAKIGEKDFEEIEKHGVANIRLEDTFMNATFPFPPIPEKEIQDLRLKPDSRAIDAGVHIQNVNDDFVGKAPDCGAYEYGQPIPHYGPRTDASKSADGIKTKSKN